VDAWRAEAGDHAAYAWHLCSRCGNAYPSAQPDLRVLRRIWEVNRSIEEPHQEQAVWQYRQSISRVGAERSYRLFAPLAARQPGRFLDIACGLGETVRKFSSQGWDSEGVDADASMERFHCQLGIRARIGQFEQLEFGQDYDIIHIAHAIYFITNPLEFMHTVRERLAPNGLFCIVLADFMLNHDPGLPSYAHSFFPTASSMRYALALAGFETVLSRRLAGSIYIAARPASNPPLPRVWPAAIRLGYLTKRLRYALIGRPYLALRRLVKFVLRRT